MAELVTFAADTQVELRVTPFLPGQPVRLSSTATPTVYGANHPAKADDAKYLTFQGDGTTTVWDEDDFAALANADVTATTTANQLRVIAKIGGAIKKRVTAAATPGAGEFKTSDVGGKVTITFGDTATDGQKIEVLIMDAADITQLNGGSGLTANTPVEDVAYGFMVAGGALFLEKYFD